MHLINVTSTLFCRLGYVEFVLMMDLLFTFLYCLKIRVAAEAKAVAATKALERDSSNLKHCTNCLLAMNKMLRSINTPSIVQQMSVKDIGQSYEHEGAVMRSNPIHKKVIAKAAGEKISKCCMHSRRGV